jgi:hypothetical protein
MVIFHSYVSLLEGTYQRWDNILIENHLEWCSMAMLNNQMVIISVNIKKDRTAIDIITWLEDIGSIL